MARCPQADTSPIGRGWPSADHRPARTGDEPPGSHEVLEIIAVLILGITTVGTAWCGYQASQWNGAQSDLARESSEDRVEAGRLFGLATQKPGPAQGEGANGAKRPHRHRPATDNGPVVLVFGTFSGVGPSGR